MRQRIQSWRWMRHAIAAGSTLLAALAFMASPAQAAPLGGVPAGGATPTLSDLLILPTVPAATPAPATNAIGPLAGELINAQNTTERLGEQLKGVGDDLAAAQSVTAPARARWEQASAALTALRDAAAARQAAASPSPAPSPSLSPEPSPTPALSASPTPAPSASASASPAGPDVPADAEGLATALASAQREAAAAKSALDASVLVESEISGRYAVLNEQFQRAQSALSVLKARNSDQVASIDSARDTFENAQAAARNVSTAVNGLVAGSAAQKAVAFGLGQLGKPYAWAEEGPDSYDCSGLTFASYLSVGIRLPRVAVDQYLHGPGSYVPVSQLLPGDLLFFSTDHNDANKIHHVAMYLGRGRMVHAPTFGEHVKEASVWWSEYFGALRVVPAAAAPGATSAPTTPAPTGPAPAPAPAPTTTQPAPTSPDPAPTAPVPSPSAADPAPTTPTDAPTATPTGSPTADPTGAPAPQTSSPAPAPTTTAPAPTSAPASPSPTPAPTPGSTPGPSPSALLAVLGTGTLALPRSKNKPKV